MPAGGLVVDDAVNRDDAICHHIITSVLLNDFNPQYVGMRARVSNTLSVHVRREYISLLALTTIIIVVMDGGKATSSSAAAVAISTARYLSITYCAT